MGSASGSSEVRYMYLCVIPSGLSANTAAQAGRDQSVRLRTEAAPRRCLEPPGYATSRIRFSIERTQQ